MGALQRMQGWVADHFDEVQYPSEQKKSWLAWRYPMAALDRVMLVAFSLFLLIASGVLLAGLGWAIWNFVLAALDVNP